MKMKTQYMFIWDWSQTNEWSPRYGFNEAVGPLKPSVLEKEIKTLWTTGDRPFNYLYSEEGFRALYHSTPYWVVNPWGSTIYPEMLKNMIPLPLFRRLPYNLSRGSDVANKFRFLIEGYKNSQVQKMYSWARSLVRIINTRNKFLRAFGHTPTGFIKKPPIKGVLYMDRNNLNTLKR